ncbi:MAG TPA: UDP-N-acetylglucosamine 2-epimerase (non-hydrolyzing) [Gammaproteobacteria bacterium]|jgi:UDP-N-acetylglucosamine 2-epimerase (non-hydrolysing)|nr:UDP-N-acetylglucosamine 2-epimerase (non-hydrolyzing) [Gammaproteobacteria bacterium]
MKPLKVMTILGTRPEIIRLARVMVTLDAYTEHKIVHTGQNYDYELNEIFFKELRIRTPDIFLNVDPSSLGSVLGNIMISIEKVLQAERPDAVLILGDTNSSIAAIMAKRMKIPVYHMEAGNRCFDANVPEEINRRIVDRISDFNLVYTEHARRHLLSEGLPHRRIYLTGSPMREVLDHYRPGIEASDALARLGVERGRFILVSIHREENVDNRENLLSLLDALSALHGRFGHPIVVSTHPRTRKRIEALDRYKPSSAIRFLKPFGFLDYNKLQMESFCVVSDSGTISEESSIIGFPAVTVRNAMERPEALDVGSIILTGLEADAIVRAVDAITRQYSAGARPPVPADYTITNVSQRVVNLILGTAKLSNLWDGVVFHDPS